MDASVLEAMQGRLLVPGSVGLEGREASEGSEASECSAGSADGSVEGSVVVFRAYLGLGLVQGLALGWDPGSVDGEASIEDSAPAS